MNLSRTLNGANTIEVDSLNIIGDGLAIDDNFGLAKQFLGKDALNQLTYKDLTITDFIIAGYGISYAIGPGVFVFSLSKSTTETEVQTELGDNLAIPDSVNDFLWIWEQTGDGPNFTYSLRRTSPFSLFDTCLLSTFTNFATGKLLCYDVNGGVYGKAGFGDLVSYIETLPLNFTGTQFDINTGSSSINLISTHSSGLKLSGSVNFKDHYDESYIKCKANAGEFPIYLGNTHHNVIFKSHQPSDTSANHYLMNVGGGKVSIHHETAGTGIDTPIFEVDATNTNEEVNFYKPNGTDKILHIDTKNDKLIFNSTIDMLTDNTIAVGSYSKRFQVIYSHNSITGGNLCKIVNPDPQGEPTTTVVANETMIDITAPLNLGKLYLWRNFEGSVYKLDECWNSIRTIELQTDNIGQWSDEEGYERTGPVKNKIVLHNNLIPATDNTLTLGTSTIKYNNIYSTTFTGNATTSSTCSGNSATATALETARNIGGVSFDGTGDITLPGVNDTGTQNTSGSSATASGLTASFDADIDGSGFDLTQIKDLTVKTIGLATGVASEITLKDTILPETDNLTNLGSNLKKFSDIHATTFNGALFGNATTSTNSLTSNVSTTAFELNGSLAEDLDCSDYMITNCKEIQVNKVLPQVSHGTDKLIGEPTNRWVASHIDTITAYSGGVATDLILERTTNAGLEIVGAIYPAGDGTVDIGKSNLQYKDIYATKFIGAGTFDATNTTFTNVPTTEPTTSGKIWSDGGLLKIT